MICIGRRLDPHASFFTFLLTPAWVVSHNRPEDDRMNLLMVEGSPYQVPFFAVQTREQYAATFYITFNFLIKSKKMLNPRQRKN